MDENKQDYFDEESLTAQTDSADVPDSSETSSADTAAPKDSTFAVEQPESEAALKEILETEAADSDSEEPEQEESEQEEPEQAVEEMELASYAADCESCATRVFFEPEDLDENGNLICPNCNETIEVNQQALEYYLVKKEKSEPESDYVVDCPSCEAVVHFQPDEIDDEENIICPQCAEKIHIETEVLDAYRQKDLQKALKRKAFLKKFFASLAGVIAAIALCVAVLYFVGQKSVVKVGSTSVPMNIYKCVYYCESAVNYRSAGFDITKKPSAQKYEGKDFETWDDLLTKTTNESLKLYYGIYNEGKKAGFETGADEKEEIENTVKSIYNYAKAADQSFEDYMKSNYGFKIGEKDFRQYLELSSYINAYYKSVMQKDVTDEQLKKIYEENPENYETVTFRYYYTAVDDTTDKDTALKKVEAIAAAKTEEQFVKLVKQNASEEQLKQYSSDDVTLVKDMAVSGLYNRPVSDLLMNSKAKALQTASGLSADGSYAEVAMIVEPRHKNEKTIMQAAISEVAAKKGKDFLDSASEKATLKRSIGSLIKSLTF